MAGDVVARVGAVWIPDSDHEAFLRYLLDEPHTTVRHIGANEWSVDAGVWSTAARNTWGTRALPAPKLFAKMLTQSPITVYDTIDEKRVLNPTETEAAQAKAGEIQERFTAWVWEDPARSHRPGRRLQPPVQRRPAA